MSRMRDYKADVQTVDSMELSTIIHSLEATDIVTKELSYESQSESINKSIHHYTLIHILGIYLIFLIILRSK